MVENVEFVPESPKLHGLHDPPGPVKTAHQ